MYAFLDGDLVEKKPTYVVIRCNGVGYQVHISLYTFGKLPEVTGDHPVNCRLLTHLIVREDAHILFGFIDEAERELFRDLITVTGIGANTARLILSSLPPSDIRTAIMQGQAGILQSVKGVGTKTAQRIIVDLRDRYGKSAVTDGFLGKQYNTSKEEALSGLIMLGFQKTVAEKALQRIINQGGANLGVEDLIKAALKIL